MIRSIIIEDVKDDSNKLLALLEKQFPEIEILAVCHSVPDGVMEVNALKPELIFLDVQLPPYTGFDLLDQTRFVNYEVIFITNFHKYASLAFRFCALDYIVKPFHADDLKEAISRYKNIVETGSRKKIDALLHNMRQTDNSLQKLGIPVLNGLNFITISEIIFCQAKDNYSHFHLTGKRTIIATRTLKWVEELLRDLSFFRVHDSYLINLHHIHKYKRGGEGGVVELTERFEVDVARRRREGFIKKLTVLGII